MNIGENILKLRKEQKLSQEELGEKIGVTRQTISNWELGETIPDTKQLIELSKVLNISIDELVNNDIKNAMMEKVSNTEKLAGVLLKILKVIGILFIAYFVIMVVFLLLFVFVKKEPSSSLKSATLNCYIENQEYEITIGDDKYYNCPNCTKQMNVYIKDITDWANLEHSIENINTYFEENGGNCK